MPRKQTEINPIRGKRLRSLLEKYGMEQQELANKLGYTKEHISYIINGKRNLTQEAAETIVKIFPETRIGWLLGYEEHETNDDIILEVANEFVDVEEAIIKLFRFSAKLLGYRFKCSDTDCNVGDGEAVVQEYDPNEVLYDLLKGQTRFEITMAENCYFRDELTRYAVFLIEGIIHQKRDTWHPYSITKEIFENG